MAEVFASAVHGTYGGDPNKVIPIRTTASSGEAEDVGLKDGLKHRVIYFSAVDDTDTYVFGRPIRSCAAVNAGAPELRADWNPEDATGTVTFAAQGATTGWLHIWSRD